MVSGRTATFDQLIVSGSNFLTVVLAAQFLPADDVAKYAYAFGFYMLVFMVANAWIYQNIMAMGVEKLQRENYFLHYLGLNFGLVLAAFPIVFVAYLLLVSAEQAHLMWLSAVLVSFFVACNQLVDFQRRLLYYTKKMFFYSPVQVSLIGFFLRIIVLMIFQPATFVDFMLILILSSLPIVLVQFCLLWNAKLEGLRAFTIQQIQDGKWMTLNIPVNWAWGQAPVFIVGSFLGMHVAGIYAAIRSIANLANVAMEMIPTFFASRLSKLFTTGNQKGYQQYMRYLIGAGIFAWALGIVVLFIFSEDILLLVLGEDYQAYSVLLWLFWGFNLALFLTRVQFLHLRFLELTYIAPIAHAFGVLVLAGSFYLLQDLGVFAMGWAMLLGGVAIVFIQMIFAWLRRRMV